MYVARRHIALLNEVQALKCNPRKVLGAIRKPPPEWQIKLASAWNRIPGTVREQATLLSDFDHLLTPQMVVPVS